jgi:isopentenyl diphosphate isomerase/L-lactate dehydrogenase-like FMN-dependent dehydrogenase
VGDQTETYARRVDLVNVADYEAAAAAKLDPGTYGYYAGGAGDEVTLRDNVAAYGRWQLRPRVLVDVEDPRTSTTVLGREVAMPVLVAPMAYQRLAHPDGEVAMARATAAAGTIMCLSTLATSTAEDVAATGVSRWFQLYVMRDLGVTNALVDHARENGFEALVVTVDAPVLGHRERDVRHGFRIPHDMPVPALGRGGVTPVEALALMSRSLTWKDIEAFAASAGLPVVVKGIMTAEDARLACEHGAAALVVSNHGGRQLDGVAATIDVLQEVVEAVDGRIEVLVDGGIRRGTDVAKAIALGARAVLVGRPVLWGLAIDGEAGASGVLELFRSEFQLALQLVGARTPAEVTASHVRALRPPARLA